MPRLPNYLRAHRKRLGLSQEEVAKLLGAESGSKVCRYEQFLHQPILETALAYEVIFERPISELFAGLLQKIKKEISGRAEKLVRNAEHAKPRRQTSRKRQTLVGIAERHSKKPKS